MNIIELKKEIERLIERTPYTKEEVLAIFGKEEEWNYDEIFAYGIALEYLKGKSDEKTERLQKLFTKRKDNIMKKYLKR